MYTNDSRTVGITLTPEEIQNYTKVLRAELLPAMGCTEPISISYAAAKARAVLGADPENITVNCSGNIIKNVMGVTVPNSGGLKGIPAAAALGAFGGDPARELEVVAGCTDEGRQAAKNFVETKKTLVNLIENVPGLYLEVILEGAGHTATCTISGSHTNIILLKRDDTIIVQKEDTYSEEGDIATLGDKSLMTLSGILAYTEQVDMDDVRDVLETQIKCNTDISQEGLDNRWGAAIGKTILEEWGSDVRSRACAWAAAGSDARMSGCPMPVVINSGSGNQGITVTMPVLIYAKQLAISHEKLLRCLLVSNLVSVYIKHYIGPLSAFCGAVSAASGAGAAITYMVGGGYERIARTVTNTLANAGGIVCDGAKPSCAAKIATSVHAALLAHYMSMSDRSFQAGEGIVETDVEDTIRNMGYIGKVGMMPTDREILNVMIDKVDTRSKF